MAKDTAKNVTRTGEQVHPVADRILVRVDKAPTHTPGGLALPDVVQSQNKPQRGEVLAVGPGARNTHTGEVYPVCVKAGDVVLFSKWAGSEIAELEDDMKLIGEGDVLAVVRK